MSRQRNPRIQQETPKWPPDERPQYERTIAVLTEAMGRARFERKEAEGRAMSVDDAVALALAGP